VRVLYVSGSFGLGHVTRDLAIARALRSLSPGIEVVWLAGEPARSVLREAGETLHDQVVRYESDSDPADRVATTGGLNLFRYLMRARSQWGANARLVAEVVCGGGFDAAVGDETYEVVVALLRKTFVSPVPYVMIYDFVGLDATTGSPIERLGIHLWNRVWSRDREVFASGRHRALFIGEPEDIPDRPMGIGLPNRREHARKNYKFIGYVLPFALQEVADRRAVRAKLGYGDAPLVIAAIGGTAAGRDLLEACARAFDIAGERIPHLRMVLVCGPRIAPESVAAPPGVEVAGFVPQLYRHFAACDFAVVQGGGTTTLELTALRRPFVYVPLEGQCEQEVAVAGRVARHRAGIRLSRADMTPERLAELIVANVGTEAKWPRIDVDGAAAAARHIREAIEVAGAKAA
jgi:UDP:flavonoid glycosyltransferase YjiC (YdhE family)